MSLIGVVDEVEVEHPEIDVWGFDPTPIAFGSDSTEKLSGDPKCPDAAMACPKT